jgi:hypothetical protein
MAKGKLFEYAILHHPKTKKDKDGNEIQGKSQLLKRDTLLAGNEQEVTMLAARQIPDTYTDQLEDLEILIRPF